MVTTSSNIPKRIEPGLGNKVTKPARKPNNIPKDADYEKLVDESYPEYNKKVRVKPPAKPVGYKGGGKVVKGKK